MTILMVFLYLVCIVSIGWSVLVFGGPLFVKRFISVYSDGALIPSGVKVSSRLDVSISRLEFNFQNELSGRHIEGFSRATKIEWSLLGETPFLDLNLGPSVVKDYATAKSVKLFLFRKWKHCFVCEYRNFKSQFVFKNKLYKLSRNINLDRKDIKC